MKVDIETEDMRLVEDEETVTFCDLCGGDVDNAVRCLFYVPTAEIDGDYGGATHKRVEKDLCAPCLQEKFFDDGEVTFT